MRRITVQELKASQGRLIDVRGTDEFASERLNGAECVPLNQLAAKASGWDRGESLILMCRSGVRSAHTAELLEHMGFTSLLTLDGGIEACKQAGVEVIRSRQYVPIYRQVMVVAGMLLLAGLLLTRVNPSFIAIDWFVALGLVFGGVTGYCPMAWLLEKMPWNQANCSMEPANQGA